MSGYTQLQIVLPSKKQKMDDFTYTLTVVDHSVTQPKQMRFPRFFVCQRVRFMLPVFLHAAR
jgi:hypothetical protein